MVSAHLGIELPVSLGSTFDDVWNMVGNKVGRQSPAGRLFGMAWHGLGYRAMTTTTYAARYCVLPKYGSAGHDGNFREDQALVDYLFNACSSLDCVVFAAYSLGSALDPVKFPSDKASQLRVSRRPVADSFEKSWPTENFTKVLTYIRDDSSIELLFALRDVAIHRGVFPRTLYVGGSLSGKTTIPTKVKELPDVWTSDLVIDAQSVSDWQRKLDELFEQTVKAVATFGPLVVLPAAIIP